MQGQTHLAVGAALTTLVYMPQAKDDPALVLFAVVTGVVGALIPDIDHPGSIFYVRAKSFFTLLAAYTALTLLIPLTVDETISDDNMYFIVRSVAGLALLIITALLSYNSSHRGFSHSLLAGSFYVIGLRMLLPSFHIAFAIGFASHLFLDLLNNKPLRLFFPLVRGKCLCLCRADGVVNDVVCAVSSGIAFIAIATCVLQALWII